MRDLLRQALFLEISQGVPKGQFTCAILCLAIDILQYVLN